MSEHNLTIILPTETERYYDNLRKKIVFHIRQQSPGFEDRITPQAFHKQLLPKFPGTAREHVWRLFWEMTKIEGDGRWIYHRLEEKWINYDKGVSVGRPLVQ